MNLPTHAVTETHQVADEAMVIPVSAEELTVGKRVVESGGVRVVKTVLSEEVVVNEPTVRETAALS